MSGAQRPHAGAKALSGFSIHPNKRQSVMMVGCQESWKAKHWTIDDLLDKYNDSLIWETVYQKNVETEKIKENLPSYEVKKLINSGYFIKIFHKLPKNWLIKQAVENKELLLELIEGYTLPKPMPECVFQKYHMEGHGERYLMLATGGTGILFDILRQNKAIKDKVAFRYKCPSDISVSCLDSITRCGFAKNCSKTPKIRDLANFVKSHI